MDFTKKNKVDKLLPKLLFIYFAVFSFGVLLSLDINFFGLDLSIHPADIVALVIFGISLFIKKIRDEFISTVMPFAAFAAFTLLLALFKFSLNEIIFGLFYLVRFTAFASFIFFVKHLVKHSQKYKDTIFKSLIGVSVFTGIFGWVQYLWLPDLKTLNLLGWDAHLFRMTGTFLDPTFTGIILVFGAILTLSVLIKKRTKFMFAVFAFLLITLLFTYSRSSYLALFGGLIYFLKDRKKILFLLIIATGFLYGMVLLPRPDSIGVKLERTASIKAKIINYQETSQIISDNPLFGVGFNALCSWRVRMFNDRFSSHSCTGSDSSIMFIMATTGVVGLILFFNFLLEVSKKLEVGVYAQALSSAFIALFIHSLFANSLFYPWVMGYMAILTGLSIRDDK